MNKIAFVDIFTTQNDLYGKNNCPIQFSCQVFDETDMYDTEKFIKNPQNVITISIIPDEEMSMAGYLTSGINDDTIKGAEYKGLPLKDAMDRIFTLLEGLVGDDTYIAGYNHIRYDLNVLNDTFGRVLGKKIGFRNNRLIDVMSLSESIIPVTKCGNYTMDSVFLSITNNLKQLETIRGNKSTMTDILITKLILISLLKRISKDRKFTCREIVVIQDKLESKIARFNFGKYKGLTLEEVFEKDSSYVSWVMKHTEKKYLVEKLRNMMDNRVQ